MKLSLFGASGDVGQELFKRFTSNRMSCDTDICLFCHSRSGKEKLIGLLNDELILFGHYNCRIAEGWDDLAHTDICVICAGKPIGQETDGNQAGVNNRDKVLESNLPVVLEIVNQIMKICPSCFVILVTNPVSRIMSEILSLYPECNIVGCGVTNDTLRVRSEVLRNSREYTTEGLFVAGEHDIRNQEIINLGSRHLPENMDRAFASTEEKLTYISKLKSIQNADVLGWFDKGFVKELPILYSSYFRHRLAHFLYKTHVSTACCVMEIIKSYIIGGTTVSVETADDSFSYIIGAPVVFNEKKARICAMPSQEVCSICKSKYPINKK